MDAKYSSETSVDFQQISRRYVPEDTTLLIFDIYFRIHLIQIQVAKIHKPLDVDRVLGGIRLRMSITAHLTTVA
jgi:hypothetical protein